MKHKKEEPEELVAMTGTASQFGLIVRALDFYCRMLAGQWHELESIFRMNYSIGSINYDQIRNVTRMLDALKGVLYPAFTSGDNMGITHDKLAPDAKRAYELGKWMQNYLVRNVKDSYCAGDPPLRVSDQPQVRMSDPGMAGGDLVRLSNAAGTMAVMLGLAGIAIEICKLCGHTHKKGEHHDCSGQAQSAGQAGVPLRGNVSGRGKGDGGAACAGNGVCACGRAGGHDDVPVRGRRKVSQSDKKRRMAGTRENGLGAAGRRTKGGQ